MNDDVELDVYVAFIVGIGAFILTWVGIYKYEPDGITLLFGWVPAIPVAFISGFTFYCYWRAVVVVVLVVLVALFLFAALGNPDDMLTENSGTGQTSGITKEGIRWEIIK